MKRQLVAITHSTFDPASRFRVLQFLPHAARAGWDVHHWPIFPSLYRRRRFVGPLLGKIEAYLVEKVRRAFCRRRFIAAAHADVVLVSRELPCLHELLLERARRLVFDFDDAIHLGSARDIVAATCRRAQTVMAGSPLLAAAARAWSEKVLEIPTVVEVGRYSQSTYGSPARVGWLGSVYSLAQTLGPHMETLAVSQRKLGFEFVIVSSEPRAIPRTSLDYRFVPWSPRAETEIAQLFDIGIMPLDDTPYQRGKCGGKLIQYMAAGLPSISTDLGVNAQIVDGGTGLLARNPEDWHTALERLTQDAALRRSMGQAARERVLAHYSLEKWLDPWISIMAQVAES